MTLRGGISTEHDDVELQKEVLACPEYEWTMNGVK